MPTKAMLCLVLICGTAASSAQAAASQISPESTQISTNVRLAIVKNYKYVERDLAAMISRLQTSNPPSDPEITSFIMKVLNLEPGDATVCSAGFFQLAGSDNYSLVASLDYSGRHFCNNVEVIRHTKNGVTVQEIFGWEVDDINSIVRDLNKNGKNELVIPVALSQYEGTNSCMAFWVEIYTLQSGALVDQSGAFTQFYQERFDKLSAEIPQTEDEDRANNTDGAICLQMQADKIERFLNISPNAGEDKALGWINSRSQYIREKGIDVLAEIGDQQSLAALRPLMTDSDPMIATAAKRAVNHLAKK